MKKITLVSSLALSALTLSQVTQADTFQNEAAFSYINNDYADAFVVGITHHFAKQAINKGPWAEATFLNKSTYLGAGLLYSDVENPYTGNANSDTGYSIYGQAMVNDKIFLNANYANSHDMDIIGVGVGMYLTESSAIYFNYTDLDDSTYDATLGYKNLFSLTNGDAIAFNAELSSLDGEFTSYNVNGKYYITAKTYLGLGAIYTDLDEYGSHTDVELSAGHFFSKQVAVDLSFTSGDGDNTAMVTGVYRF